jgi:hypothetical protein
MCGGALYPDRAPASAPPEASFLCMTNPSQLPVAAGMLRIIYM